MGRSAGRIGLALAALGLLAAGFAAGILFAPVPRFEIGSLGDDPLEQAWDDFIRAQQETVELFRNSPFYEDDQERSEAYRSVLYGLIGSIRSGALADPDHPRFTRAVDWSSKSGLDNPDNNYYTAIIGDDAEYRVTGTRGSSRNLVFQLLVGQPGMRDAGSSTQVSALSGDDIMINPDGSFDIHIGRTAPAAGTNWLPSGGGAQTLLVRYTHSDWRSETAGNLQIEKIGSGGESAPPLTPSQMALGLQEAAVSLFDRSATWLQYSEKVWSLMPRNAISSARATQGGMVGQYSAFGSWELDNDTAIVLSTAPSDASYQGIALGNLWFVSLDYETRTSSLTLDQMQCSSDGRCYAVISHRDPGIPNWLDTGGHRRGLIMMRWQGLDTALPDDQHPRAELVDFETLRDHLPADTPQVSEQQRADIIRERRRSAQRRFNG